MGTRTDKRAAAEHYSELARQAEQTPKAMCMNCRTRIGGENGLDLHIAPCLDCGSDGHASCQHAHG